jgi:hypothetical protein
VTEDSRRAGERVMALLRKLYDGLRLQINEAKSAVASAFGRKFLGCELWVAKGKGNPPDKPKAPEVEFSKKEVLREEVKIYRQPDHGCLEAC